MRKVVFAAAAFAGVMSLGLSVKTVPALYVPAVVEEGTNFKVEGAGFLAGILVEVCEERVACQFAVPDSRGKFIIPSRTAPAVPGTLVLTATQFASPARGSTPVSGRVRTASATLTVVDSGSVFVGGTSPKGS